VQYKDTWLSSGDSLKYPYPGNAPAGGWQFKPKHQMEAKIKITSHECLVMLGFGNKFTVTISNPGF